MKRRKKKSPLWRRRIIILGEEEDGNPCLHNIIWAVPKMLPLECETKLKYPTGSTKRLDDPLSSTCEN
jgi:hypothetical protein